MLDRNRVKAIQADIDAALQAVATKHNLSVSGSRAMFNANSFKLTANFGDKTEIGDANPEYRRNFMRRAFLFGLNESHLGREFRIGQKPMTLVGMNKGGKAVVKAADGKDYLYDASLVAQLVKTL